MTTPVLTLHHSPNTRSTGALILLEELGAPHELHVLNMKAGEQRQPAYLAINPMGKVPALTHGDALITEQAAVFLYLADLFPQAGLAPAIGDPLRGPYLRWMAFYGSCFEPALIDRMMKRDAAPMSTSPYGDWDTMFKTLTDQLTPGPYLLGERFTAADVLYGTTFALFSQSPMLSPSPVIDDYVKQVISRPAHARAQARDKG